MEFSLFTVAHFAPVIFAIGLIIMAAVITAMFGLAYLPWYLKDKKKA